MKKLSTLLFLLFISLGLTSVAQTMNCQLDITVTAKSGESLAGVEFELTHVDYSLVYPATVFDAQGKFSTKVYAGKHHLKIEKKGLETYEADFDVTTAGKQLNIEMKEAVRVPFALKADVSHDPYTGNNDVLFYWNREEPVFFDDFESHEGWAIKFGDWTGIDGDQLATVLLAGNYPNSAGMQYAQIINPLTVDPVWWYEYPVLRPFSGQQYVGFIRTGSGEANDDWLISPMVTVGNENVVSFMAKAGDRYAERFQVCITTVENPTADDFTLLSSGNYETVNYENWEKKVYDLSEYTGQKVKIAIHYISDTNRYGAFMLMVDDFFIGQQQEATASASLTKRMTKAAAAPNETFHVYLDGSKVGETSENSYLFNNVAVGNHTLGVKAVYTTTETEIVTLPLSISSEYAALKINVKANSGASVDGLVVEMIEKNTGKQWSSAIKNGSISFASLPYGTYLVNIKSEIYESYSNTLDLRADKTLDVELKEIIFNPLNITVNPTENAEGKFDVAVTWNKDLGYLESFETMPDFATGSFGGWKSIDVDKLPVYPIALGDISNIVSFPGSGTQTAPTPIAPMVFNPYKTVPAMAPMDKAIIAPDGDKTICFFSTMTSQSDKWLIAPKQHINDNYKVSFVAKAYGSYPEIIEICISTTDDAINSFVAMDKIQLSRSWTTYELDLSEYKDQNVFIGVHYISTDAFLAQLDMFYVGPASETNANVGNVVEYEVYLDNKFEGKTNEAAYNFKGLTSGSHTVGIKAKYKTGESELVNYNFQLLGGVEDLEASSAKVVGTVGAVVVSSAEAAHVTVFNAAGQMVVAVENVEGEVTIPMNAGLYLVKVGTEVFKVAVR